MKGIRKTLKRRRFEHKTDYKARRTLLSSGRPRLVIRKTNRYIIAQIVVSDVARDRVIFGVSSKDLIQKGWPDSLSGSLKSLPAAYLTGLMLAGKPEKTREAILDAGLHRNVKGGRIYAVLRGAVDGGLKIPCNQNVLPNDKQLQKNERLRETFLKIKEKLQNG